MKGLDSQNKGSVHDLRYIRPVEKFEHTLVAGERSGWSGQEGLKSQTR